MSVPEFHHHKHPRFHRIFYDFHDRGFLIVNDFLAFFTVLSLITIVLETIPGMTPYHTWLRGIEYLSVGIFSVEYIVRLYAATHPLKYALSFFGIIDLISILPTYLGLGNFTPLKSARMLRLLRFFRLVRLSKIARFEIETYRKDLEEHAAIYRFNLIMYFFALFSAVMLLGGMMTTFETENTELGHMTGSMLWVFTVLVGAPVVQATPVTGAGIFLGIVTKLTGMIMLGFLLHVVGDVLNAILFQKKKQK